MQAPPPFQLVTRHFGLWRAGLLCLSGVMAATLVAWATRAPSPGGPPPLAIGAMLAFASVVSLRSLARIPSFSLRWDSQAWWLGDAGLRGHEPVAGQLTVTVDLGAWMLLRFTPVASLTSVDWPHRIRWLPVQRAGHETSWHVLRSTVHAAGRPAFSGDRSQPQPPPDRPKSMHESQ
jgi:hypothetical protein